MFKKLLVALSLSIAICPCAIAQLQVPTLAAPAPFSFQSESVDVETIEQTVKNTIVRFGDETSDTTSELVSETATTKKAVLLTVPLNTRSVSAFTAFNGVFKIATINELTPTDDHKRHLLSGVAGQYLVFVDTETGSTIRPVTIEKSETAPPENAELAKLSADLARQIDDRPTQVALAKTLAVRLWATDLETAKSEVQSRIKEVLLAREGDSLQKDWLNGWRRPVQAEIAKIDELTFAAYELAIKQVAMGLVPEVDIQSTSPPKEATSAAINAVVPFSAYLRPAWSPPSRPWSIGQRHQGRILQKVCRADGTCVFIWQLGQ